MVHLGGRSGVYHLQGGSVLVHLSGGEEDQQSGDHSERVAPPNGRHVVGGGSGGHGDHTAVRLAVRRPHRGTVRGDHDRVHRRAHPVSIGVFAGRPHSDGGGGQAEHDAGDHPWRGGLLRRPRSRDGSVFAGGSEALRASWHSCRGCGGNPERGGEANQGGGEERDRSDGANHLGAR